MVIQSPLFMDLADNLAPIGAASHTVKVDKTPPTVSVTGVTEGAIYVLGSVPAAGCSTTDGLSGVAADSVVGDVGRTGRFDYGELQRCGRRTGNTAWAASPTPSSTTSPGSFGRWTTCRLSTR